MAQLTKGIVWEWLSQTTAWFTLKQIDVDLDIGTAEGKKARRSIFYLLVKDGYLEKHPFIEGKYRFINREALIIDWQSADPTAIVPLKFPFELEKYAKIFPKSIVIVAGSKNTGKTGFLYNFLVMNMDRFGIDLFNSETGREQMKERLDNFTIPEPAPFRAFERYDNFADVIDPDRISIIDYLDLDSEVYLVGAEINKIFQKLNKGVAVIGLQKPPPTVTFIKGVKKVIERDLAYGGSFTAKRAILYITMSNNKLKLLYVKNPAQRGVNPNNMQWTFRFSENGCHFEEIQQFFGDEFEERL